jgi:hypothetical protein
LSITYSSGLSLSGSDLATLATYYDEVWLPYPFNWDPESHVIFRPVGDQPDFRATISLYQEDYVAWKRKNALLFEAGILKILPPPYEMDEPRPPGLRDALRVLLSDEIRERGVISSLSVVSGVAALAVHTLAGKKPSPEIFLAGSDIQTGRYTNYDNWLKSYVSAFWLSTNEQNSLHQYSREELSTHLIRSLFQFVAPSLPELGPEAILETRKRLLPFKRGFTEYVISLTDEIENAVASGKDVEEVARAVADRKVITEANQFIRQHEPSLVAAARDVVGESGGFFKLLTVQSTQAFWATLLPTFFKASADFLMGRAARAREMAQNSSQAFAYLGSLSSMDHELRSRKNTPPEELGFSQSII